MKIRPACLLAKFLIPTKRRRVYGRTLEETGLCALGGKKEEKKQRLHMKRTEMK